GRGPEPDVAESPAPAAPGADGETLPKAPEAETPERARWRSLLLVYGAFVISGFIYRGSLTFIPAHIEEEVSISLFGWEAAAVAGALSTLALLGGAIGWYTGGMVSERFRKEYFVLVLSPIVAALLFLTSFATDAALLVVIFIFVIVNFAMQPAFVTLVADYSPPGRLGASFGISFFLSFGMGSFAASFAGFFADRWGTDSVFAMLAVVGLLGTLLTIALVGVSRRRLRPVAAVP
ncbi:MAG TPA: MFS transporter, partial [Dehalococcoidia bacterium]|nr:MFS transporter [Dehalococcoidia bacterium]